LEASALTHAGRLGLLGRRSPLLRLQGDERLIAMIRSGQERAFDTLVERYQGRLLAFCRGMLPSAEDAEDILQEVFVAAHKAILADNRAINARPWLYRIARNRCLNHLRRPVPEGQDSMDVHPHENGVSVAERVQTREEFRALIADVQDLPETQRTALLLREIDALAYEEIALAMDTTVPAVKSLLVRARMSLADCSQGRHLTCDEVHLELAEAAEGLRKASGPARAHMRGCERCRDYRKELRRSGRALAALAPIGPLAALHGILTGKLGWSGAELGMSSAKLGTGSGGGASAGASSGAAATGGAGAAGAGTGTAAVGGAAAAGSSGMTLAGGAAAGGLGGALGTKAAASVASMALLTAGAVEVKDYYQGADPRPAAIERSGPAMAMAGPAVHGTHHAAAAHSLQDDGNAGAPDNVEAPEEAAPVAPTDVTVPPAEEVTAAEDDAVAGGAEAGTGVSGGEPSHAPATNHATPSPTRPTEPDPTAPPPVDPTPTDPPPGGPPPVEPPPA
jgi:RNA polymerase sigma factor (sigma-70 family)